MIVRPPRSSGFSDFLCSRTRISGFTLIELMIAMVLGLILIGAVITVFLSTQQSYRLKTNFDNSQEALRFASHAILRVVQTSQSVISEDSTASRLNVDILGRDGALDCVGNPVPEGAIFRNTFYLPEGGDTLICEINGAGAPSTEFELVEGVEGVIFRYADAKDDTAPVADADYKPYDDVDAWGNVRSVRTTLRMRPIGGDDGGGLEVTFTSTSRGAAIGDSIIVSQD